MSESSSMDSPGLDGVWSTWTATNQIGEPVCTIEGMGMFGRRPQVEDGSSA